MKVLKVSFETYFHTFMSWSKLEWCRNNKRIHTLYYKDYLKYLKSIESN
jgi:hypothetical protein